MALKKLQICGAALLLTGQAWAEVSLPVGLEWSGPFSLPPQADGRAAIGVGAPFAGEHNGVALLAGGSNFPDEPLVKGGKKRYCAEIYALLPGAMDWVCAGRLSQPAAEGLSATTPRGVVCVGGSADGTPVSRVFLLTWDETRGRAAEAALPDFPCAIKLGAAAAKDSRVYVAGGETAGSLASDVWMLDLEVPQAGWRPLPPLPGPKGRMQAVAFVQNGDQKKTLLHVIGGYAKNAEGVALSLTDGYAYDLSQPPAAGRWRPIAPARPKGSDAAAWPLIGAKCLAVGDQHALVFGGLDAAYFDDNQRKMATLAGAAREAQRIAYQSAVPTGWNRRVLAYHTVTDRWFELGEVPNPPTVAGAAIKLGDGRVVLASGEVRPGIRTPDCVAGTFVQHRRFHPLNWAVMGGYFGGLAFMGWWFMRKKKSADDYFKGGGRIPWWAAGISIFAAMFSSITFLAVPALAYMSDWRYAPKCACIALIPPLVICCYLPFFRKLNLTCAYEYLELRFNLACRLFASLAFNLFMVARVAVVAYLPALAVAATTGADVNVCIVAVSILTILYCAFGGIEAVIWSDVVQTAVLVGGSLLILVLLVAGTDGGLAGVFQIADSAGKFRMFDFAFDFSRPVVWVVLIGGIAECLISYTSDQCVIQRYMTTKNTHEAARSLWLNVPFGIGTGFIFFSVGTALYTFYRSQPERLAVTMPKADSILPLFIANDLPAGVAGLVLAGLFAATITTLAANLNSSATAITSDWFVRLRKGTTDRAQVRFAQTCTIAVGLAGMAGALALANADIRAVYDQFLKAIGILTSGLACLFMLGIFARRVGAVAALTGLAANYVVCIGLDQASLAWKPHLLLYGAIGIATCLAVALAVSVVFPNRKAGIDGLIWKREERR
ncbi:MAG TPA: sodium/solute symporter [Kiritimatiellia bacterium]|nr:sodium/solute symporter [Kiritimatiellia bacterium]HPS06992.1 sodium/solute symporter [Kiritimatiellia bacterium]